MQQLIAEVSCRFELPQAVKGKLTGMAFRVPTPDVSVVRHPVQ